MNFISIRSPEVLSKYFGQTEAAIRELFARARAVAPCVLFFDDFDALAKRRYLRLSEPPWICLLIHLHIYLCLLDVS